MKEKVYKRKYIKGLDALRGIAALLVIIGHVELVKVTLGYENVYNGGGPFFLYLGSLSVTFFFVLSGFLITYLLLIEKSLTGEIKLKNFYLRRVLRIWPVYYILFILGFLILPILYKYIVISPVPIASKDYWPSFTFNFLLLPNFIKPSNPLAFQSWSIGVEEQFYIFWPLLFIYIKSLKKLIIAMVFIVISIFMLRSLVMIPNLINIKTDFFTELNLFFGASRFDNMAVGGLAGIYFYLKPNALIKLWFKIGILVFISYILIFGTRIGFGLDNILAAIPFACLLIIIATNDNIIFLETKFFKFLGRISYGLYMYHILAIYISLNLIKFVLPDFYGTGFANVFLHILSILVTILIASISYTFIEKYFLKFKK